MEVASAVAQNILPRSTSQQRKNGMGEVKMPTPAFRTLVPRMPWI